MPRSSGASTAPARVEAFSDAVFAIAITLLVLDLPAPEASGLWRAITNDWASFLAYIAAFFTLASIWVHHRAVFARVRKVEPIVVHLNLLLLFGVALTPWPTRLLSGAIGDANRADGIVACALFSAVSLIIVAAWTSMTHVLARQPELLKGEGSASWMRRSTLDVGLSAIPVIAAVGIALVNPTIALFVYIAISLYFFFSTSRQRRPTKALRRPTA